MRYPQTFIDDLKRQAEIVRVVQDYVPLKKKGANWMACCPFHKEKTPSFSVSPTKEIYFCFGCHKGGSVFNFVMEIERVSFPEAIKIVADKVGMPLPKMVEDSRFEARRQESDDVIQLNSWAMDWWEQQLESSKEARIAREYLVQRELTEETQKAFRLGYAPDSWEALSTYLRQKGAAQQQIERSGLVVKKEEGSGSYDRFRGRLMIPVLDVQGRPIAFGGRALKPDDNAKYINSPETIAYVKGRNLFGLNLTRDEIRRQGFAILVEGFLDLIVPFQAGVRNVVASLGTALTAEQAKLLSRFARKVVVNYDGDRAGVQAAKKSIEILLAEDIEVKVLVLPDNADPDEFIRKFGVTEYQRRRAQAQPHIQFVIENALRDRSLHRPADKAEAVEEVLPYIRAVNSRIQKREYFDMAMDSLGIDRENVNTSTWRRELWQAVRDNRPTRSSAVHVAKERKVTAAEQRLLGLLLADANLRHQVLPMLKKEDYEDLATAPLFEALLALDREGTEIDFDALMSKTEGDEFAASVVPMVMMNSSLHGSNEHYVAEECVSTFRLMRIEQRIEELRRDLAIAEREEDFERVSRLAAEQIQLAAERQLMLQREVTAK
ncbi:MAG TPA: DNA primase [Pyrinomonadaceae bacterium]|nr:DNA primase [Pyrinomonadaceae bacterium]